jgi:hypothetical protein
MDRHPAPCSKKPSRRWQFGVRSLLVLFAVLAVVFGWFGSLYRQSQFEERLATEITRTGGSVQFADVWEDIPVKSRQTTQGSQNQPWWKSLANRLIGRRIVAVEIDAPAEALQELNRTTHLRTLRIHVKRDVDRLELAGLRNLESLVVYANYHVRSLAFLSELKSLQSLTVSSSLIKDLKPVSQLQNLRKLDLHACAVDNLAPLARLEHLTTLRLDSNPVSDLTPLKELSALEYLDLSTTLVTDLRPLAKLKHLHSLGLSSTRLKNLTPLQHVTSLHSVSLNNTKVNDLTPLANLSNLQVLMLAETPVENISVLANLTNLSVLVLQSTHVNDVSALKQLTNLRQLELADTPVSNIRPLGRLKNLRRLDLNKTRVENDQFVWLEQRLPKTKIDCYRAGVSLRPTHGYRSRP